MFSSHDPSSASKFEIDRSIPRRASNLASNRRRSARAIASERVDRAARARFAPSSLARAIAARASRRADIRARVDAPAVVST